MVGVIDSWLGLPEQVDCNSLKQILEECHIFPQTYTPVIGKNINNLLVISVGEILISWKSKWCQRPIDLSYCHFDNLIMCEIMGSVDYSFNIKFTLKMNGDLI